MNHATPDTNSLGIIQLQSPTNIQEISLFTALQQRKTTREISKAPLSLELLSNLLWAAFGVNRKLAGESPGRTAASASNSQEIDLYVALKEGIYLYDAINNQLKLIVKGDWRVEALNPHQRGNTLAPVQLIYVVDIRRLTHTTGYQEPGLHDYEVQKSYYFVDTGLIAGNVYLFAAAQGLGAWFHNCDKISLTKLLNLRPEQRVLFAHSIGYPEKEIEH